MSEEQRNGNFWPHFGEEQCPILFTVEKIPSYEAVALVKAHVAIAEAVMRINPDVLLLPERGAAPTGWMLEELLLEKKGKQPFIMQLPLGTYTDATTGDSQGLSRRDKVRLIDQEMPLLFSMQPHLERFLLIDEVQGGGTIVNHSKIVRRSLQQRGIPLLHVLGIEDTRNQLSMKTRAPGYNRLMGGEYEGIIAEAVQAPLSLLDRQQVLNRILFVEKPAEQEIHFPHMLHNTRAIKLLKLLTQAYGQPELFQWSVEAVKGMSLPEKGLSTHDKTTIGWFAEKILCLCDELSSKDYDRNVRNFVEWLTEFTQFAMHFPIDQG